MDEKLTKHLLIGGGIGAGVGILYFIIKMATPLLDNSILNFPLDLAIKFTESLGCTTLGCVIPDALLVLLFYAVIGVIVGSLVYLISKISGKKK